jgi:trigger factor
METTVEPLGGNKVRLHIAVPTEEFEKALDAAFVKIARDVRIPGFRPGKAPRRIIEARIGMEAAREQALRDALPEYYADAVIARDLDPIAAPEIDLTSGRESGPVEFDAVVEIRPQIELDEHRGLRVTVENPAVAETDVDQQIDRLRDRFADLEESRAPLSAGDYAQIDLKGYVHEEIIEGLSATDFLYEVGSGAVVPKLDDELLGKRPGDILKFNDVLPERFGERAGQEVAFQVLVKETQRKVLPAADDDWAREASEFDTLAALRADVRRRMELVRKVQAQVQLRERVLDALADLVTIEAPEPLVREEMERRLHDVVHRLEEQGIGLTQYLEATGTGQDELLAGLREGATKAVKADLALRAVIATETIEPTPEEIAAEVERLAQRMNRKVEKVRRDLERSGGIEAVRSDIARGKALQFLVDHADVVDDAGQPVDLTLDETQAAGAETSATVEAAQEDEQS